MSGYERMADAEPGADADADEIEPESESEDVDERRERAARFADAYIDDHQELFDRLARE